MTQETPAQPHDYTLPGNVVQAMFNVLNQLPASQSRHLLNAMEQICAQQDAMRNQLEAARKAAAEEAAAKPARPRIRK